MCGPSSGSSWKRSSCGSTSRSGPRGAIPTCTRSPSVSFPASTAALQFVWSRGRCTQRFDPEKQDHYWAKNFEKVKRKGFTLARVLMIDDSPEALADHFGNHLKLQRFEGQASDSELRDVLPFLKWLSGIENLRSVEKRRWREFVPGSESTSPPQGRHVDIRKRNIP